jgi:hypothetical protein
VHHGQEGCHNDFNTYAVELTDAEKRHIAAFQHMNYPKVSDAPSLTGPRTQARQQAHRCTPILTQTSCLRASITILCTVCSVHCGGADNGPTRQVSERYSLDHVCLFP